MKRGATTRSARRWQRRSRPWATGGHCWSWRRSSTGPLRFNDLQDAIAGIAPNILSERLRRLEREGLAVAQPYSERPPRYVYELTTSGTELAGALRLLADWGARHSGAEPVRHDRLRNAARGTLVLPNVRSERRGPGRSGRALRLRTAPGLPRMMIRPSKPYRVVVLGEVAERLKAAAC